jgi:hypothetical protein
MSNCFEMALGLVAGALLLTSLASSGGGKKTPYTPMKRTNPLTENNFSFKPQYEDDKKKFKKPKKKPPK